MVLNKSDIPDMKVPKIQLNFMFPEILLGLQEVQVILQIHGINLDNLLCHWVQCTLR